MTQTGQTAAITNLARRKIGDAQVEVMIIKDCNTVAPLAMLVYVCS